jgi:hypothetical protein
MKTFTKTITLTLLLFFSISAFSQTVVSGYLKDSLTQKPLSFASVYFKGSRGVTTDKDGHYSLSTINLQLNTVVFSYVGYQSISRQVEVGKEQELNISLPLVADASNVTVTNLKRAKYSNKNNPAVDFIRLVIEHKDKNKPSAFDHLQYEEYDKMELALTKAPEKLVNSKLLRNYKFLLENKDTTKIEGKALIPVYLKETISQKYFRNNPDKKKTYVLADRQVDFGEYIDNKGIQTYLNRMYENIDIYSNNIPLLSNSFLSPLADGSPAFYRFYLGDTLEIDGAKVMKVNFSAKNLNDLLFRGFMLVTLDGKYAVRKIDMSISKHANLNWVNGLKIKQGFEQGPDGRFHVINSDVIAEFAFTKSAKGGIMGERSVSYKNYIKNVPAADSVFTGEDVVITNQATNTSETYWTVARHQPLSTAESAVYYNVDSMKNMKSYKRLMSWATLVLAGYKSVGNDKYEIGPVSTFYSFNPVEGFRLRAGGRSTPKLSKTLYFENYVAYGFKDEKWKGFLSTTYSLNHKSIYAFPLNYVRFSYQRDTKIPGQELQFVAEDNFLLSFKRGDNDKWTYNNVFKAEYVKEFENHLSYTLGFKNWKQSPAGTLSFTKEINNTAVTVPDITTTELSAEIRWAPNEQFYQGKVYRIPIINKYPIFKLRLIAGVKGLFGSEFNYQNLNLGVSKRFYYPQFGYTDVSAEGGYIFGKVPYPLLSIHRANQSYFYQLTSYNLMNFMEFVSDRYAAINVDHYFNGFILNRVPLLKKLKLREIVTAKVLFGGVREENKPGTLPNTPTNPESNNSLKFPVDKETGMPITYALNKQPYVEVSAGIGNIFKLLRVDVVRRLTYLDNPEVSKLGIRARVKFDF